jgi:hypothetical protein
MQVSSPVAQLVFPDSFAKKISKHVFASPSSSMTGIFLFLREQKSSR